MVLIAYKRSHESGGNAFCADASGSEIEHGFLGRRALWGSGA